MNDRQSIRLKGYDYSKKGLYFVTVDVQDKLRLFWDDIDENGRTQGSARTNEIGLMIEKYILKIPKFYSGIGIDEYVVMPDHVHMIINIVGADPRICPMDTENPNIVCPNGRTQGSARTKNANIVGADPRICPMDTENPNIVCPNGRTQGSARTKNANIVGADPRICPARTFGKAITLGEVVQRFKMITTKCYIENVINNNWPRFHDRLWQRNYFERIIRDELELIRIKKYIKNNPRMYER